MCGSHRAHSRHYRNESEFFEAGHPHWQEFFMRGRGRGGGGPVDEDGGGMGVRRPLRFLAYKLELDDKQVTELAKILDALKTERAQAAVDDRRSLTDLADAVTGDSFDAGKSAAAGERRVVAAQRLRDAVSSALSAIHAMLNPQQRERLAYLIRTGVLVM